MSGNWRSDWRHLSHLNIPERVASRLKLDSFSSSCSKKALAASHKWEGGGERKEGRKKKNGEEMQQVSDI